MSYAALIADGSTSAAAESIPSWVSGAWGLLGTAVGGVITFFTTRSVNNKAEEAARKRERTKQITEISRFGSYKLYRDSRSTP